MGFWSNLLGQTSPIPVAAMTPNVTYVGSGPDLLDALDIRGLSVARLWRTQPHLRTVVSFRARNIAHLGLHVFARNGEDRKRDRTSPLARLLAHPNADQTTYELVYALVGDLDLYDRAYWLVVQDAEASSGWSIRRLPPPWVSVSKASAFAATEYLVSTGDGSGSVRVPASSVLAFGGYHPTSPLLGSPTIESLRETLLEQVEAAKYRSQVWKRGGRVSAVIQRPKDAPSWSPEAMQQFREDWYAKYTGYGPGAGGTPILEDGMTLQRIDFNAQEQQFVEAAKLALSTVASAYHINPTMVGVLDNANYSNVREFRRMLYGDSLGPTLAEIEGRINTFLLPMIDADPAVQFVEFNIAEKLQGSFEEQAAVMQTMVGAPIMTRNEGRAKFNLPALGPDFDQPVTPLNVLVGGQASPTDSAPKMTSETVRRMAQEIGKSITKGRAPQSYQDKHAEVVGAFFRRQAAAVKSKLGAKAASDWWDGERWDSELSDDLYRLAVLVSKEVSAKTLEAIGFSPDEYDVDRTLAWLREVSDRSAKSINAATKAQLDAALEADDPTEAVTSVFTVAEGQRTPAIAATTVTLLSGFATHEAAKQVAGDKATKTWITGPNPRPEHARMNGETVPLSENFSNGMAWPGDGANAGPDDLAGCNCQLSINV